MPKRERVPGYPDLFRIGKKYHVRFSLPGLGVIERSTGETNLRKAKRVAEEIKREASKLDPSYLPRAYLEVAEECYEVRQKNRNRESTVKEARYVYDRLVEAFGHLHPDEVTDAVWLDQVDIWRETLKRRTFGNFRKYAVQIDNFAFRRGYKKYRNDFPIQDPKPREGRVLSNLDFRRLLRGTRRRLRGSGKLECFNPDAYDFLILARGHGSRRGELWRLTWDRVDFEQRCITLRDEDVKTGRGRTFPMTDSGYRILQRRRARIQGDWVFPNRRGDGPADLKSGLQRLARRTGVSFKPHDLRHTFLTEKLIVEKQSVLHTSVFAGVQAKTIQDRYLHAQVDDLRGLVKRRDLSEGKRERLEGVLEKLSDEELSLLKELLSGQSGTEKD